MNRRLILLAAVAVLGADLLASDGDDKKKDPEQIGARDVAKGINLYSLEKEIALGKQLAVEFERGARLITDPVVSEYVSRVGQNLVRNSDARFPFTIKVVWSDVINAFAFPGGFFYVSSALILSAATEAELAGAMAHEIAHVAARHSTREATRANVANYASIPLIFIGGWPGYGAGEAAGALIPLGLLKFGREFEAEADMLGLQYMYKTGYDPTAFVDFFERLEGLEKKKPGAVSRLFLTHPPTAERVTAAQKNIQEYLKQKPEYVVSTAEFQKVKDRLAVLTYGLPISARDAKRPSLKRRK